MVVIPDGPKKQHRQKQVEKTGSRQAHEAREGAQLNLEAF